MRPTALITGASKGIGLAIATALAPTHDLLLGGRDQVALKELADTFPSARPFAVEVTDHEGLAQRTAGIEWLDVLVHSAGMAKLGHIADTPAQVWRDTLELNVIAVAELTRLLLPALRAAHGQVVLINSGAGQNAHPNWGSYAASKFALRAFADVLRAEEQDLRVTTVYPGRVATDMQRSVREQEGGEFQAGSYLRPESVAAAVLTAITATPEAHIQDITVRPKG
ncbi:SDR family oxidoreductase [Pseudonocardiaceae bacterium YIM PH 21723]|nr:SDR family oxidoreductase [Pseudonocardiaceae bacterium YIM PH 21723]